MSDNDKWARLADHVNETMMFDPSFPPADSLTSFAMGGGQGNDLEADVGTYGDTSCGDTATSPAPSLPPHAPATPPPIRNLDLSEAFAPNVINTLWYAQPPTVRDPSGWTADGFPRSPSPPPWVLEHRAQDMNGDEPGWESDGGFTSDSSVSEADRQATKRGSKRRGKARKIRNKYTASDLEYAVRVMADDNPFSAPHGQKGRIWKANLRRCQRAGYFRNASMETFRNKMTALMDAHQDGFGSNTPAWIKKLPQNSQITMAALLERIINGRDRAKEATDEERAKKRMKEEEDKIGGEEIRRQSMQPRRKRAAGALDISDGDQSDSENCPPRKKARKLAYNVSGGFDDVLAALTDIRASAREMAATTKESVQAYTRTMDKIGGILERALAQNVVGNPSA